VEKEHLILQEHLSGEGKYGEGTYYHKIFLHLGAQEV
jgi:hypothetical protein